MITLDELITSRTESLTPITFRGSSEDRQILHDLGQQMNRSSSEVIRVALRVMHGLASLAILHHSLFRVHVNEVIRTGCTLEDVIREGKGV